MSIKVGTYNIQHSVDRLYLLETNKVRCVLPAISDAIQKMDLDICGLTEVWNHPQIEGMEWECNQTEFIAKRAGYPHYYFAKAIPHGRGGEFGNALLSKYPILSVKCIPIHYSQEKRVEGAFYEDRVILVAEISVGCKAFTVVCTHLGLQYGEIQLGIEALREVVKECKNPLILMGDMNFFPTDIHYSNVCEFLTDTAALMNKTENTFPSEKPTHRIDYIFKNDQVKCLDVGVPDLVVSDHRPYTAVIEF